MQPNHSKRVKAASSGILGAFSQNYHGIDMFGNKSQLLQYLQAFLTAQHPDPHKDNVKLELFHKLCCFKLNSV